MAVDVIKLAELDKIKGVQARLDAADQKVNDVFSAFNIPDDITDNSEKVSYALTEIGDNQTARTELREKNEAAQKEFALGNKSIEEDFIAMTNIGNKRIARYAEKMAVLEEEFKTKELESENKKNALIAINDEITALNNEKVEIQGLDGKGGKIGEEIAKANVAKDEASEIARQMKEIDKKIKEIDAKILKIKEANKNTNDPEELKKNAEEIAVLQGDKVNLKKERIDLSNKHIEKKNEQSEYSKNVTNLENDVLNLDSKIEAKDAEKDVIENELRLTPIVGDEIKQAREDFEAKKQEYILTVDSMEKTLNERGINVKAARLPEEPIVGADDPIVVTEADPLIVSEADPLIVTQADPLIVPEPDPLVVPEPDQNKKKNEKNENKDNKEKTSTNSAPQNDVQFGPFQNEALPVVTPEEKKKANFDYITGYSDSGVGLSSDERLQRIKSEIGGRDFEAMVRAFEELKKSPSKLTKDEKTKLQELMETDQKNLAQTIKDIDGTKLEEICALAKCNISKKDLKSLYYYSFEAQNKNTEKLGKANYGILSGFKHMPANSKSNWEKIVTDFAKNKETMAPEDVATFEKYIITPLKFGTLNEQSKVLYQGPVKKLFSNFVVQFEGGNKLTEDIRAAIAKSEVPVGQKNNPNRKSQDFADCINQIEPNPPIHENGNRTEEERNKDGR
jgi:hypothetical protein